MTNEKTTYLSASDLPLFGLGDPIKLLTPDVVDSWSLYPFESLASRLRERSLSEAFCNAGKGVNSHLSQLLK